MLRRGEPVGPCSECRAREEETERLRIEWGQILADLEGRVRSIVIRSGVSPRDADATLEGMPAWMLEAVPPQFAAALDFGLLPERGFGLMALPGSGKTSTLSALLKAAVAARLVRQGPVKGVAALEVWPVWLSWPSVVNRLRISAYGEHGHEAVQEEVRRASTCDLLVLDDLGSERVKGSGVEDWSVSQLDLIVDARDGARLPTWYSTTCADRELVGRYGARLYSRLCGRNPLIVVNGGRDMRFDVDGEA